ncbi:MAG: V-type ATP synthase subunit B [Candidatus Cloacimonadota bacterium]|nr:MAG: V-type ATP synthase subunit B [Candidatus Cloacimonadota bacterium]
MKDIAGKEYIGLERISGPIIALKGIANVGYEEIVEIKTIDGELRTGRVLLSSEEAILVQVFAGTSGLSLANTRVRFLGEPFKLPVSSDMLGRIFSGLGKPIDGAGEIITKEKRDINGLPINPVKRDYPREFIQTGISTIDGMNTLIRGQKLPIFSGSGLPHNELAAQITKQAKISEPGQELAIVFAAIGIKSDDALYFQDQFSESGAMNNVTMFLNLANDPPEERVITPRCALTLAEYLAFEQDMHVLVILTDMTNYCEALREIASAREEVPSRKGYPGYLYSDLASLYERTGRIAGKKGSITQIPILSMPNMDINHPIPDLTGYITEGQIVISLELHQRGIFPPINVLPSLSRLMKDGIGEGYTRADHPNVASQLYSAYADVHRVRSLASIIGEDELTETDKRFLKFGQYFEDKFINQGFNANRSIEETLNLGWQLLSILPKNKLDRVSKEEIEQHYKRVMDWEV